MTVTSEYQREYNKRYYQNHKTEKNTRAYEWRCRNPEKTRQSYAIYRSKVRLTISAKAKLNRKLLRQKLFVVLGGPICIKCGFKADSRALHFDHIRDDGGDDRRIHYSQYGYYVFYVRNPDIARANLQVLCANCNEIKKYNHMGYKE